MRSPIEAVRWVREAFQAPQLPVRPTGKITRQKRSEFDRERNTIRSRRQELLQRRRTILKGTGLALGGAITLSLVGPKAVEFLFGPDQNLGVPAEFTGEIEETREFLGVIDQMVGQDGKKLEKNLPIITSLATSFFCRQMQEMFPERKEEYQVGRFNSIFNFMSEGELKQKKERCEEEDLDTAAFADHLTGTISIAPERISRLSRRNSLTKSSFVLSIHELLHTSAKLKEAGATILEEGERVDNKKGLTLYRRNLDAAKRDCYQSKWWQLEEVVVEHAALELAGRVTKVQGDSSYRQWVESYLRRILPRYNGRFEVLLAYQQKTDLDGFLASVGGKFSETRLLREQIQQGIIVLERDILRLHN